MPAREDWPRPFFFVHVMKTAGLTLDAHIDANFSPEQRYPTPGDRPIDYMIIKTLREAVAERADRVKIWRGHFPWYVTSFVPDAVTLSLLREPVARTISMLAQYRAQNEPEKSLEAVYDDPFVRAKMLGNHQTKVFSLTEADAPGTYLKPIEVDAQRLATAKANLEQVELLGLTERFPQFLDELESRHGWTIEPIESINVGEKVDISASLRERIVDDTAIDTELYEHARKLAV